MFRGKSWGIWLLAALAVLCPSAGATQDVSAEDIVARCAQAMGGSGHLETLRTLRFEYRSPDRGRPLRWEVIRPNLIRKEREGHIVLVFDGHRAGFLEGPVQEDGTLQGPHLVPEEDWHHFEMDIALYIPAFFDFPAEHVGRTTVDGNPAHLLQVTLPMGGIAVYAIDAASYLPVRVDLPGWDLRRHLGDFRKVGDILYPHRFWNASDPDQVTVLEKLAVNVELDPGRFVLPASLKAPSRRQ